MTAERYSKVDFYDVQGRLVYTYQLSEIINRLNVSFFPKGVYLLDVDVEDGEHLQAKMDITE